MNKIFIDCGANVGQSVHSFMREWNDWEEYQIHSFEANPSLEKPYDTEVFLDHGFFRSWISEKK